MIHFLSNEFRAFESEDIAHNKMTLREILDYCLDKPVLAVDTETEGLDFLTKRVVMFQIGDQDNQFVIDTRHYGVDFLKEVLESPTIEKVFHNVKFDYKFIKHWYNITCENVYDTMLSEQVIHCGKDVVPGFYSLEQVQLRYLNIQLDKSTRNQFIDIGSKPFTDKQIQYGAGDVSNLLRVREKQKQESHKLGLELVTHLENQVALAFADIEYNGMGFNAPGWLEVAKNSTSDTDVIKKALENIVYTEPRLQKYINKDVQLDLFQISNDFEITINWSSPLQVKEAFQKIIPDLQDVNSKNLYTVKNQHEIIAKYIEYKEGEKKANAYGTKFLKYVKSDTRVHTSFQQILNTGRVSSKEPNMQQIPADNKYRNCFVAGIPNYVFVSSDYSSQELNIIAHGSQDPVWIQALKEGKDLHSVCAELVYGRKWEEAQDEGCAYYALGEDGSMKKEKCDCKAHKKLRNGVKSINFGLAYGMSAFKLSDTLLIPIEEAEQMILTYFSVFPSIKHFLEVLGNFGVTNGYIRTFNPYRRIRWFSNWVPDMKSNKDKFKEMGQIERASKNTPIQGSGADMCKYALTLVRDYIRIHNVPVKIVMAVHDQIDTIVHVDYAEEWKTVFDDLMFQSTMPTIPSGLLKADTNISDVWEK